VNDLAKYRLLVIGTLNDERGTGGQTKFAGLLHWDGSTIRRRLAGKSKITHPDELAIRKVVESAEWVN
jgi:hypothetical protein